MAAKAPSTGRAGEATGSSEFDRELEERFLRYVRIDTQTDETSTTSPSTEKQFDLLRLLVDELKAIGAADVTLTDYGAVLATIPATAQTDGAHDRASWRTWTRRRNSREPASSRSSIATMHGGDIVLPDDPRRRALARRSSPTWPQRWATTSSPPAGRRCWAPTTRRASPSS